MIYTVPTGVITKAIACCCVVVMLWSCSSSDISKKYGPEAYEIFGTMEQISIEGGCWKFTTENGIVFELSGNDMKRFLKNGIHAKLVVRDIIGASTICMTGKLVEILAFTEIKKP